MLWAGGGGGGGYPGVVSIGPGSLVLDFIELNNILLLRPGATFGLVSSVSGNLLYIHEGSSNDGLVLKNGLGLFGATPPSAATTGGAHTAGGTYTAVEQAMLEACYTALQSIGLVT